jgi:hypothetical protein
MDNASPPPKQVQPASAFFPPRQMKLVFEPSLPDSEPISVSKDPFDLYSFKEALPKTTDFIGIKLNQNLMSASCLDISFLRDLASKKNPDIATSGFIADAIGNNGDICLWLNAKFSLEGHTIPEGLFIHLFTHKAVKKMSSHEVCSMIIQVPESSEPRPNIRDFLTFLFSKASFANLECLMLYGFQHSDNFSPWIGKLNLKVFHMAKFGSGTGKAQSAALFHGNTLKRLYVVHPDDDMSLLLPGGLEKLVIYCPESGGNVISRTKSYSCELVADLGEDHAHEGM